jgi:hypothetical protein
MGMNATEDCPEQGHQKWGQADQGSPDQEADQGITVALSPENDVQDQGNSVKAMEHHRSSPSVHETLLPAVP